MFRWLRRRARWEQDLDDEIRFHLAQETELRINRGESPAQARLSARRAFGSTALVKEVTRMMWRWTWLERLGQDLRFALRTMRKHLGFSVAAIVTLAVGIGATTAVFSVIDAVMLRPLAYPDPDRLYVIHEVLPQLQAPVVAVNAIHFREWLRATRSFQEMALLSGFDLNLTGLGAPERIPAARASPSLFPMLGVRAELGRTFLEEEDQPGHDRVVVLSHELWRRRFAEDPQIIGRTIALDGEPHTIVGVLADGSWLPKLKYLFERPSVADRPQLWKPFALWNEPLLGGMFRFACIARVKPGVSAAQALADLNAIQANIANQARLSPTAVRGQFRALLVPLQEQIVNRSRSGLELLLAAVAMVLVIGCVNVAHLLFARGSARDREMAIRRAIGATEGRLVWQMLVESLIVSAFGGLTGVMIAYSAVRVIQTSFLLDVPRLDELTVNGRMVLFTLVTSMAAGLVSGLVPAWQLAKTDPLESMKSTSPTVGPSKHAGRLRWLLVSLEVCMSTMCLVAGGLLLHSFVKVISVDPGFHAEDVVSVPLNLTHARYRHASARVALADRLLERVRLVHGVRSAGITSRLPLNGQVGGSVLSVEGTTVPQLERPQVSILGTDPGYFRAIGIPVQAGRIFDNTDRNRRQVAVVAASLAGRAWPGQNPVGQRFRFSRNDGPFIEVVGVVGNVRSVSLTDDPPLDVYLPYWQSDMSLYSDQVSVVFRTVEDAPNASVTIRAAIHDIDPELPLPEFRTMDDIAEASVAPRRFEKNVVLLLAAAAMLLASLGIYGVVSQAVAQRTNEIGIRMALGARARDVRRLVFTQSFPPVVVGLGAGLVASSLLGGLLRGLLFGVSRTDPWMMTAAVVLIIIVAAMAIAIPARRATQIEPLLGLRCE
jgi:predicted permease